MKLWTIVPLLAGLLLPLLPLDAEAKRFGGGRSFGMQRQAPAKPATPPPQNPQNTQAAPANNAAATPAAGAAAAAPGRSWMGPVAGLAAGLGLAALASHLGFGEGLANFMMIALLAVGAVLLLRFVLRRFAGNAAPRPALQRRRRCWRSGGSCRRGNLGAHRLGAGDADQLPAADAPSRSAPALPADFDRAGFERIAKMIFIRMQAANDSCRPRRPAQLHDAGAVRRTAAGPARTRRGGAAAPTSSRSRPSVLDVAQEDLRQVVSVRFHGLLREAAEGRGRGLRRGLASGQAGRRQPQLGHRRHPAEGT